MIINQKIIASVLSNLSGNAIFNIFVFILFFDTISEIILESPPIIECSSTVTTYLYDFSKLLIFLSIGLSVFKFMTPQLIFFFKSIFEAIKVWDTTEPVDIINNSDPFLR